MKKIIAGIAAAAAFAGAANAAVTVTQTFNYGDYTNFSGSLSFDLFNASLGTLTGVTITDSYGFTTTITVKNNGTSSGSTGVSTNSYIQLNAGSGANSAAATAVANALNQNVAYSPNDPNADQDGNVVAAAGGQTSNQSSGTLAAGAQVTLASRTLAPQTVSANLTSLSTNLAAFVGTGQSTLNYVSITNSQATNSGGNFTATQTTQGNGAFSIFYTYDAATSAVPEPATWALMIGGFGLVGYGMRRRGTSVVFN